MKRKPTRRASLRPSFLSLTARRDLTAGRNAMGEGGTAAQFSDRLQLSQGFPHLLVFVQGFSRSSGN